MNSAPMALVREIIRQGKKNLTAIALVAGMPIDWLAAAGAVSKVVTGLVSLEGYGLAQNFRRAVQSGAVVIEEFSEHLLICRLQAQSHRLPFVPTRAGLGTDILKLHAHSKAVREETDSVTGESYVACSRLPVEIALVHCHESDELGNMRVNPKLIWMDNELVNAAERTIATTEAIIATDEFRLEPWRTTYPSYMIDSLACVPNGALPTSLFPTYSHDSGFYKRYASESENPKSFATYFERQIINPQTWNDFLAINDLGS
jgi:glutaconate CoA-transferase subunit A